MPRDGGVPDGWAGVPARHAGFLAARSHSTRIVLLVKIMLDCYPEWACFNGRRGGRVSPPPCPSEGIPLVTVEGKEGIPL